MTEKRRHRTQKMSSMKILFLHKWFLCLACRIVSSKGFISVFNECQFSRLLMPQSFCLEYSSTRKTREGTIAVANFGSPPPSRGIIKIYVKEKGKTVSVAYICSLYLSDSVKLRVHLLSRWRGRIKIFLSTLQLKEREKCWLEIFISLVRGSP